MLTVVALALSITGLGMLALSMHRHHRDVFGVAPTRRRMIALRVPGWTLLAAAGAACVVEDGWPNGSVLWVGILTVAALAVVSALCIATGHASGQRRRRA